MHRICTTRSAQHTYKRCNKVSRTDLRVDARDGTEHTVQHERNASVERKRLEKI